MVLEYTSMPCIDCSRFSCSGVSVSVFPLIGVTLRSGSIIEVIARLNSFNPENAESTIKRTIVPIIILTTEISVIIFTAFVPLLETRYLFAIKKGNLIYDFFLRARRLLSSSGLSSLLRERSIPSRYSSVSSI